MKKLSIKKWVGSLTLSLGLLIPTAAFASSTGFVYDFSHQLTSNNYSMNGDNVHIYTNTTYYSGSKQTTTTFTIALYRNHWYGDDYIASRTQNRYGSDTATWNGVGSATYHFVMKKSQDGQTLKGDGKIYN